MNYKPLFVLAFVLITVAQLFYIPNIQAQEIQPSNYEISIKAPFNQVSYYPLKQEINRENYLETALWVGRLILPTEKQINNSNLGDWAWLEIYQAPLSDQNLVGQIVTLTWQEDNLLKNYKEIITTDVNFSEGAKISTEKGNVTPIRLNNRKKVGPLQSLAGARPIDDVIVSLSDVNVTNNAQELPVLKIFREPTQVTGRFYGLVQFLKAEVDGYPQPKDCPGEKPCPTGFFRVRHYNTESKKFDGLEEIVHVPQQPPLKNNRFASTPRQLENSPAGKAGWYIYGAKNKQGIFTVQALKPRSLVQLEPQQVITGQNEGLTYLTSENWRNTPQKKGKIKSVLVDSLAKDETAALNKWQEGDLFLVIHSFGGIGGEKGESLLLGTVTGHFAYGLGQIVRDPLTQELQFDIKYEQVYAQNTEGIVSGTNSWANYMGNLQRGWLGTRPVSDVLVKLDAFSADYNFDGLILSPIKELMLQLQIMTARYRTGDGTGNSAVTPSTSCVQDSNQALYIAIKRFKAQIHTNPKIIAWLQKHPDFSQNSKYSQLVALEQGLIRVLVPQGVVRPDWQNNVEFLSGSRVQNRFISDQSLETALLSWRSILPREAYDQISRVFLEQGASLWFLQTNQVGGFDPDILPLAPTPLFGEVPIISEVARRILAACLSLLNWQRVLIVLGFLLAYGLVAIPLGMSIGFLRWGFSTQHWFNQFKGIILTFFCPALLEELVFRVVLLPHPTEDFTDFYWFFWAIISLVLFIIYHPLNAKLFYKHGNPTFFKPSFLGLTAILGIACTFAYYLTGSLWVITLIHWVTVVLWLYAFGGVKKLRLG